MKRLVLSLCLILSLGACAADDPSNDPSPSSGDTYADVDGPRWDRVSWRSWVRAYDVDGTQCILFLSNRGAAISCDWSE